MVRNDLQRLVGYPVTWASFAGWMVVICVLPATSSVALQFLDSRIEKAVWDANRNILSASICTMDRSSVFMLTHDYIFAASRADHGLLAKNSTHRAPGV